MQVDFKYSSYRSLRFNISTSMHNNIERRLSIRKTSQNKRLSGNKTEESGTASLDEETEDVVSVW